MSDELFKLVADENVSSGEWFLLPADAGSRFLKTKGCWHFKAWMDDGRRNYFTKAAVHFPDEPCTIPHDEIPSGIPSGE